MESEKSFNSKDIWVQLSEDSKKLAIAIATGGGLSQGKWFLEAMSKDEEMGFELDKGTEELFNLGILEEVTLIQEKRERLSTLSKPREIMLMPLDQVPLEKLRQRLDSPTEGEREYLRLDREIKEYEEYNGRFPERYKGWEEPRFRLRSDLQEYITDTFDEQD